MRYDPKDDVLISDLPAYIRKTREEFDTVSGLFVSYKCEFEPGTVTGDAVFLDEGLGIYKRGLAGDATLGKFTGIADVDRKCVTHMGVVRLKDFEAFAGTNVFLSSVSPGKLTTASTS